MLNPRCFFQFQLDDVAVAKPNNKGTGFKGCHAMLRIGAFLRYCRTMGASPHALWIFAIGLLNHISVMKQPFNNYSSFCPCLLLFGFVDDIIKGQQHKSDFISFYLCLSLFGYLLSLISYLLSSISYLLISGSYPIGGYLDHILLVDKSWLV